jgi:chromosome segregation ATPase
MEKKVIAIAPTPSVPEKPKPVPPPPPPRLSPPPTATVSVVEKVVSKQTPPQSPLPPSPSPPSSAGASNTAALQQQQQLLKKYKSESKKSTQDVQRLSKLTATLEAQLEAAQAEMKKYKSESKKSIQDGQRLTKLTATLEAQLEAAQAEMQAQQDELQRAAETMQQERLRNQEEHEDLLDDHDDQVEKLTAEHEARFEKQENMYQEQLANLQGRVQQQEEKRMQEGGDWTKELEDALARERDALKRLDEVQTGKNALESGKVKLEMQQEALQSRVGSLSAASETAVEREREAEEKLDEAMSAHKRQLNQRQTREAELERTVAELGAALTLAQQQRDSSSGRNARALVGEQTAEISYKDKYEVSAEELETVKTQLSLATQRSEALQQELQDVSNERIAETAAVQERQHEHDGKVATLTTQVSRLDASLREIKQNDDGGGTSTSKTSESAGDDNDRVHQLMREVDKSKRQIASLSDQLIRQQGSAEATKSEILALKGRLQAASARAEAAEQTDEKAYEMEGGGVTYTASKQLRRRVKSGRGKSNQLQTRSVRSALGMRLNEGSGMEQIALTIDALDAWMLDTGSIMRHEPLARVGFALYLALLHLWCFVLVFFHAVASEHGDLGSLTVPRAPGPLHVP